MTLPIRSLPEPRTAIPADLAALWIVWHKTGWTGAELMEFWRLKATLARAGVGVETKFGITEAGSPWCAMDLSTPAVPSALIICTEDGYVADWPGLPGAFEVDHLAQALTKLADAALNGAKH